jgi:hypothetical protein
MTVMTVVGLKQTSFKPEDSDREIRGVNLWAAYDQNGVEGKACDRIFVKESALPDDPISLGDDIEILYNKWGKVDLVRKVG